MPDKEQSVIATTATATTAQQQHLQLLQHELLQQCATWRLWLWHAAKVTRTLTRKTGS